MQKIIAIANQKGGVGKTTTCVNLSSYLALMGQKVLVIDIDPQGNCTSGFGVNKTKIKYSTYHVLMGEVDIRTAIIPSVVKNLDILPSNIDLAGAEVELVSVEDREKVLKKALLPVLNAYDFIIIDCPPSLALLTVNAITASKSILIPIQGEYYALEGLSQLMNTIKLAKKHLNPSLEVEGVVLTMYDSRSRLVQNVTEEIYKFFGKKVFECNSHIFIRKMAKIRCFDLAYYLNTSIVKIVKKTCHLQTWSVDLVVAYKDIIHIL